MTMLHMFSSLMS